jgi:hypothetical protein
VDGGAQAGPRLGEPGGVFFFLVGAACAFTGRGLLLGQGWSQWAGIALGVLHTLWWPGAVFYYSPEEWAAWWSSPAVVPAVIVTVVWLAIIVILLRRRTRDWMAFARRLRSEYKQQRAEQA